jgi:hypothetical protein
MRSRVILLKNLSVETKMMEPYLKMDHQTLPLKNGRRFWTREPQRRTRKPVRTRKGNKRDKPNCCNDKPDMDLHGLKRTASYLPLQILQMEVHDAVAVTRTKTVNRRRIVEAMAIPMDHPAIQENLPILSHVPILIPTPIRPKSHKAEVMTIPKRKVLTTVISRIFTKAV